MSIAIILIVVVLVLIDQVVKFWALTYLAPIGTIPVINGLLSFTYVENRGAAYGSFSNYTQMLAVISFLMSIGLIYLIIKFDKYFEAKIIKYGLVLTLAGAIGNFIDRAFRSFVVDMFQFTFIDFPVFNVADICVVIGTAIIMFGILFLEEDDKDKNKNKNKEVSIKEDTIK